MNELKKFLTSLQYDQHSHNALFIFSLLKALPQLLTNLLKNPHCQSVERLQITDIRIVLVKNFSAVSAPSFRNIKITKENKETISLYGELYDSDIKHAHVEIDYFVRGQRKFFTSTKQIKNNCDVVQTLSLITKQNVELFFSSLQQNNDLWHDHKLAQLNGRATPQVPTQMLIALLLLRSLKDHNNEGRMFHLHFAKAVGMGHELRIAYGDDSNYLIGNDELMMMCSTKN